MACGTGNAALLAAERGADVVGVDFEPRLLALARERGDAARVRVQWRVGDVASLPLPESGFTAALSVFGAMYAPDHTAAARELARVCAPGARLALTAWVPGSFMPAMGDALASYLPPPPPNPAPRHGGATSTRLPPCSLRRGSHRLTLPAST